MPARAATRTFASSSGLRDLAHALAHATDDASAANLGARYAVSAFCDWCVVDLVTDTGEIKRALTHKAAEHDAEWDALAQVAADHGDVPFTAACRRTGSPCWTRRRTTSGQQRDATVRRALDALRLRGWAEEPIALPGRLFGGAAYGFSAGRRPSGRQHGRVWAQTLGLALALIRGLHEAADHRAQVLAELAHDLRTPLGVMDGAAYLLERRLPAQSDPRIRQFAEVIRRSAQSARVLAEALLAGPDAAARAPMFERRSPAWLVHETRARLALLARTHGIRLHSEVDAGLPAVSVDVGRMGEVFDNLVSNALKFTPTGGVVTVGAHRHREGVCFRVSDTGSGFPAGAREHLFQPFWQGTAGDTRGRGMGLAICRRTVIDHGGRIWAETAPGGGAAVAFTLPAADARSRSG